MTLSVVAPLVVAVLLVSFPPAARPQCLTHNDDMSQAVDVDLHPIQDFHVDLFRQILPKDPLKNFIFSPYSIWNALALAYMGARGQTESQFRRVLRVHDKLSTLRKVRELEFRYRMRSDTSTNNTFVLSNRVYFDSSIILRTCMMQILHAEMEQLDFKYDSFNSAEAINAFVRNTTRGHITQLVTANDVVNAYLVLVNAAYFKGAWASPFERNKTRDLPFHSFNMHKTNVPMMFQYSRFNYSYDEAAEFEMLKVPYIGDTLSMLLFKPYSAGLDNFNKMVEALTSAKIEELLDRAFATKMHLYLPRFSIESIIEDEMLQAVFELGLRDAFIPGVANFGDFSLNPNIKLDNGIHKAFVSVTEEGTEAGAATAFIANKIGGTSEFNCDRPFVFAIVDHATGNVLFMGAYKHPDQSAASRSKN